MPHIAASKGKEEEPFKYYAVGGGALIQHQLSFVGTPLTSVRSS